MTTYVRCAHCAGTGNDVGPTLDLQTCPACLGLGELPHLTAADLLDLQRLRRWQLVGLMVGMLGLMLGLFATAINGLTILAGLVITIGGAVAVACSVLAHRITGGL